MEEKRVKGEALSILHGQGEEGGLKEVEEDADNGKEEISSPIQAHTRKTHWRKIKEEKKV